MGKTSRVVIGMDPHKRSATIETMADDEEVLGRGRFETDAAGFEAMLAQAQRWPWSRTQSDQAHRPPQHNPSQRPHHHESGHPRPGNHA